MYSPKEYWADLARGYDKADATGFAPVLHPKAPSWFNEAIDELQYRALRRALSIAKIPNGSRMLDVGCGTGRWLRRFKELGFSPVGVDATYGMLRIARSNHTSAPLITGSVSDLPFTDAAFDALSDITVIQHIPYELQPKALQEMVRVLRPGGRMILLELIRGQSTHIFPRLPFEWIREVESCGTNLIKCFGQEFFFPDHLFALLAQAISRQGRLDNVRSPAPDSHAQERSFARRAYWSLRRITVPLSSWIEPVMALICPVSLATHAVFVFQKRL